MATGKPERRLLALAITFQPSSGRGKMRRFTFTKQ
jgi:hypothetical protein